MFFLKKPTLIYFYKARNMSSANLGRIKSVHSGFFFLFLKSDTNIVRMRKKRETLINFLLAEKYQNI